MRTLFITIGAPGTGKSTWIKENNLEQYTISPDEIRLMFQTPQINTDGSFGISQKNDREVWNFLFDILEKRMERGDTTIIDATHTRPKLISRYKKLADKYRYRIVGIDFREYRTLDNILKTNELRGYKKVPEDVIETHYLRALDMKIPSGVKIIKPDDFNKEKNILFKTEFQEYNKIAVIGDIHGCYTELLQLMKKLENDGAEYFIFCGDYFDRGDENAQVFEYLEDRLNKNDTLLLTGNHERHLKNYEKYIEYKEKGEEFYKEHKKELGNAFTRKTFFQFMENDIDPKRVNKFYRKLGQLAYFKYGNKKILITHGGIPIEPSIFIATSEYINGVGGYENDYEVAQSFVNNTKDTIQIHGHRNMFNRDIFVIHNVNGNTVLNINGNAEFGGELRAVMLSKDEDGNVKIKEYKQKTQNPNYIERKRYKKIEDVKRDEGSILTQFRNHKFVNVKNLGDNIYSCNFTSKAFRDKKWDSFTVHARGFFVWDNNGKEVVIARSYNKFFNINEREETKISNLKDMKYPVDVYHKYNGYLGILSVYPKGHEKEGQLFFASKSTNKGEYAKWFEDIVRNTLSENQLKDLSVYLLENNVSMIFEVIKHKLDPHIVKYRSDFVVLLDIIENDIVLKQKDYKYTKEVGESFGFNVKEHVKTLNSFIELYEFIEDSKNHKIEGYVFEDQEKFKVKLKSEWYNFWKRMRGIIQTVHTRLKKGNFDNSMYVKTKGSLHTAKELDVFNFFYNVKEGNYTDIISLRDEYESYKKT